MLHIVRQSPRRNERYKARQAKREEKERQERITREERLERMRTGNLLAQQRRLAAKAESSTSKLTEPLDKEKTVSHDLLPKDDDPTPTSSSMASPSPSKSPTKS